MVFSRWPQELSPLTIRFTPTVGAARSGGRTLSGSRRMTTWQAGGIWRATYSGIPLVTPEKILLAEMIEAILDGGAEPMAIPRWPGLRAPTSLPGLVAHSDGTPFSDGSLYAGSGIAGILTEAASLYDTTLSFSWAGEIDLMGGDFEVTSPEGPRLHRIKRFVSRSGSVGGLSYEVEISPPLRCDLASGAEMNFADPHLLARLANPEAFAAALEMNRYGFMDAEWVEA